ncbi:enoyl-CoA hydratase domain-containing protein 2, mitochondrial-like [Lutra lutra]|uniref:enoyl-CoA hydratase domain-containing protein 2, mitochondrial-like n=1 Tax=Lutra lutra TaxID=9657 RepID=UPI001FD36986|nr:enoyl-CoA hydratase domain-containing protein 2, mitochondrial-like [Lutra lutra]
MLRALTSALRLPGPWGPLRTRGCASHGATGDPEIQVRALTGRDQGITEILMNRPSARNALGNVLVSQLLEALAQLREDQQVRCSALQKWSEGCVLCRCELKNSKEVKFLASITQLVRGAATVECLFLVLVFFRSLVIRYARKLSLK